MVMCYYGSYVEICVEDDGVGFDLQIIQYGCGLKSQIKCVQCLGGKLCIDFMLGMGMWLLL